MALIEKTYTFITFVEHNFHRNFKKRLNPVWTANTSWCTGSTGITTAVIKRANPLVGGCSVAVLCLATARTSCLTAVRTFPLTRRLSFPILPLGPWLSSPRRSLSTPLSTSRARSGITHEYSSTGRFSPYPSDAPSHESSSRDQIVANYHPPRLHRICALNELDEKSSLY